MHYYKNLVVCVAGVFEVMIPCCLVDGYSQDKRLITQRTAKWVSITPYLSVAQIFRTVAWTQDYF